MGVLGLFQARSLANEARAEIQTAVNHAENGDLDSARLALQDAEVLLDDASDRIGSPWVGPIRVTPFVGTEVRAASAAITAAHETSLAILDVLDYWLADRPTLFDAGRIDIEAMSLLEASLVTAVQHVQAAHRALDDAPDPRLRSVRGALTEVDETVSALSDILPGARSLVARIGDAAGGGDPFRILLLLENGAERRATGGLIGFLALFEFTDGLVTLARFEEVTTVHDPTGTFVSVDAPAEYLDRYSGFLANTTLWSNVNLSPDFPTVADVAGQLYAGVTGTRPHLVARIDLSGLGYVLDAFPGLTVENEPLDPDSFATDFVVESYTRFPVELEQDVYLVSAVDQGFNQVLAGIEADKETLLRGIQRAVAERRVAVVADTDEINRTLEAIGADGALPAGEPGDVEVVVQNFAANKIDIFTATDISVGIETTGCTVEGEVTVTLTNLIPGGLDRLPEGVFGSDGRWWVSFYLPRQAEILALSVNGEPAGGSTDVELGRPVVSVLVRAEPGATTSASIRWQEDLTGPDYRLRMQPQPLVVPATLSVALADPVEFVQTQTTLIPTDCKL